MRGFSSYLWKYISRGDWLFIKNETINLVVFILWSRLGTPLCKKFTKPDGSPYQSGTEYEYDLMCDLQRQTGSPRILPMFRLRILYLSSKKRWIVWVLSTEADSQVFFEHQKAPWLKMCHPKVWISLILCVLLPSQSRRSWFFFATLSLVILLTVQNSEQYFTAQELIKNYY